MDWLISFGLSEIPLPPSLQDSLLSHCARSLRLPTLRLLLSCCNRIALLWGSEVLKHFLQGVRERVVGDGDERGADLCTSHPFSCHARTRGSWRGFFFPLLLTAQWKVNLVARCRSAGFALCALWEYRLGGGGRRAADGIADAGHGTCCARVSAASSSSDV